MLKFIFNRTSKNKYSGKRAVICHIVKLLPFKQGSDTCKICRVAYKICDMVRCYMCMSNVVQYLPKYYNQNKSKCVFLF